MSRSLLSTEKVCYICGSPAVIRHHVFGGTANRRLSEKHGCWVYLCPHHHNMSNEGVHFDRELDLQIKRACQSRWEAVNGGREDFIRVFGKSYL